MILAAIYNVWDAVELLKGSIECIQDHVDHIIIVHQRISNYGEDYNNEKEIKNAIPKEAKNKTIFIDFVLQGHEYGYAMKNETKKRNTGINYAKDIGCTHYLLMDCDEYYENFKKSKHEYLTKNLAGGSVCKMFTYFKSPTLRFESEDNYYVPFIHKLNPDSNVGIHNKYPFYVDPTRRANESNVDELVNTRMHHFSWVRKDIERKIRNSSARTNISKSQLLQDYNLKACPGSMITDYRQKLVEVVNQFDIKL